MKIASIDVGLKRIGLAISLDNKMVFPQEAILRKNRNQASRDVGEFLKEWNIDKLVVGLPKGGSTQDEMTRRIKHFVSLIDLKDIEVVYQNEAYSSMEAKELTKGVFRHKRDGKIDSISAQIILQRYLGI
jgi:putative Holliday junction resolvase